MTFVPPDDSDLTGRLFKGRYRILERIGEGGMGSAWLAEDEDLRRRVVVKTPRAEVLLDRGFRARFEREVRSLLGLDHPHVTKVLDAGTDASMPFLVLPWLAGGSLEDRLASAGGRLALADVLTWIGDIARALDFIHSRGFVHRDVKPGNVLFDDQGNAFLGDFGIARAAEGPDGGLTQTGALIGSPRYMAPEVAAGRAAQPESDQYALATVAYVALAGVPPHDASAPLAIVAQKTMLPARSLRDAAPDLAPGVVTSIMRGLEREPSARHPTCTAFTDALAAAARERPAATSGPPHAGMDTTVLSTPEPRRSRARLAGLGLIALVALTLAGLKIAALLRHEASPPAVQPAAETAPASVAARSLSPPPEEPTIRPPDTVPVEPPAEQPPAEGETVSVDTETVDHSPAAADGSVEAAPPAAVAAAPVATAPAATAPIPAATAPARREPPTPTAPVPTAPTASAPTPTAPVATAPVPTSPVPTAPRPSAPVATAPVPTAPRPTAPVPTAPVPSAPVAASSAPLPPPPRLVREGRTARGHEVATRGVDGARVILVPAGSFRRGSPAAPDEQPVTDVSVSSFWLDETEVTWRQYRTYMTAHGIRMWKSPSWNPAEDHPIVNLDWEQASAYCAFVGGRLPTEAEWEFAARGPASRQFPWGEEWRDGMANSADPSDGFPQTAPVGSFRGGAGPFGHLDLAGNVTEWVADWYDPAGYPATGGRDPRGPASGTHRVLRGGGFNVADHGALRGANRAHASPDKILANIGFRCAMDP